MMPRTLGFDWKVQLAWLDDTAAQVAEGTGPQELRGYLDEYLQRDADTELSPTARSKAITVLSHLRCNVPQHATSFRDRALSLLREVLPDERVAVHWSMASATYPFFTDVTAVVGRMLALQGETDIRTVRRRVAERWGERSTVARAVGVVVGTMRDWGTIDAIGKGRSVATPALPVPHHLSETLVEGLLLSGTIQNVSTDDALHHPSLFPFKLNLDLRELRSSATVAVDRLGGTVDVIRLASC
ncbi:MAG: hypothetical protein M3O70_27960 [Actinomycetota bacterium]|nr:hypothetical protein [Actinomycetota bacterium]